MVKRTIDSGIIIFNRSLGVLLVREPGVDRGELFPGEGSLNSLTEVKDEDLRERLLAVSGKVLGGSEVNEQLRVDGHPVMISGFPHKEKDGKISEGIILLQRQTPEARDTETDLKREVEYAEEANKLKSEFIASLSHEIRTPLNAIIGFTEQLKKTSLDGKQKDYLEIIDNSSYHLLDLVNEILTFSKLESGEMELDEIDFRLESMVKEIYTTFRDRAETKQINFRYHFDERLKKIFRGDAFRLKQILINLVNNAVKFTELGFVELGVFFNGEEDGHIRIGFRVTDSGIGISEDKIQDIFQEFKQADAGITRKHGGTGLGLAICKRLAELMNGTITVKSTEGRGSEFTVEIPLKESEVMSIEEDEVSINSEVLSGRKVLIVDDDAMNRLLGKIIMEDLNMKVDLATDGTEAIRMMGEKEYDVILLDIHMPGISGIEVARNIRQEMGNEDVKIIAVTAAVVKEELGSYFDEGINDYLIKPYREINLYNKICKVLDMKSQQVQLDRTEIILYELNATPLYNLYELRRITRGNDSFFREMITTFTNNAREGLESMKEAADAGDMNLIGETAHRLIPSYTHIDVKTAVSDLVELKRRAFENPDEEQVRMLISQIEKITGEVIDELEKEEP